MTDTLKRKIHDAYWEAKEISFPHAPEMESFARGVEHGLSSALLFANQDQATNCAGCGQYKHTPLRRDEMDGYVCLTCIDKKLDEYLAEKRLAAQG